MQQAIGHQIKDLHEVMQTLLCGQEFVLLAEKPLSEVRPVWQLQEFKYCFPPPLLTSRVLQVGQSRSGVGQEALFEIKFCELVCKFLLKDI